MNVHTLTIHVTKAGHKIPAFIGGHAAVLLRQEFAEGSTTRNWIDLGAWQLIRPDVMVLEIIAPNAVAINQVISAVNRAVKEYMPELSSMDWITSHFSRIACINQNR